MVRYITYMPQGAILRVEKARKKQTIATKTRAPHTFRNANTKKNTRNGGPAAQSSPHPSSSPLDWDVTKGKNCKTHTKVLT